MSDTTDTSALIKKTFPVTGMHCASCASTVEKALKAQKGVVTAGVNYANARAYVEYVPQKVSKTELKEAVEYAGYDLVVDDSPDIIKQLESAKEKNYTILRINTILALIFSIPVVVISMFLHDIAYSNDISWALATPVVFLFGRQFFIGAWKQAKHFYANMDTLVALSTSIAYLYSVFNTVDPQFWRAKGIEPHVYFEASSVIITFILLGKLLEERAKTSASSAIKKLIGLQPNTVTRINKIEETIPIADVQLNDILLIKPGEKIPVDGRVTEGSSYVDESMISGEPVAMLKETGSNVLAGTINQKGSFHFVAEKLGSNTLLAHIIRAVEEAQGSKAPVQKLADKIAGVFVPIVISIAILSFLLWLWLGGSNGFTHGILALVTVLIIACPCALGLATPAAIIAGVGKGAENGILIKDAQSLELAHKINAVVLDKTGTITEGHPEAEDILWQTAADSFKLSSLLYSIESRSEHPLAGAVTAYLMNKGAGSLPISSFQSFSGMGVSVLYHGQPYYIGSKQFITSKNIVASTELQAKAEQWLNEAKTVIWFADNKDTLAIIAITDKIKISAPAAVSQLQSMGIKVYMLTGDNAQTAKAIAAQAGIKHYKAETLPADKAAFIKQLQSEGKTVAMAGDGINDSEALALADVSIAMGKGADIAMDVAKMTLISSDLLLIPKAINLSGKTVKLIRQNLFWAFIYNVVGIPLAAGILYPVNGFLLNPMIAGAAMALSSVSVVSNSLRLKRAVI